MSRLVSGYMDGWMDTDGQPKHSRLFQPPQSSSLPLEPSFSNIMCVFALLGSPRLYKSQQRQHTKGQLLPHVVNSLTHVHSLLPCPPPAPLCLAPGWHAGRTHSAVVGPCQGARMTQGSSWRWRKAGWRRVLLLPLLQVCVCLCVCVSVYVRVCVCVFVCVWGTCLPEWWRRWDPPHWVTSPPGGTPSPGS